MKGPPNNTPKDALVSATSWADVAAASEDKLQSEAGADLTDRVTDSTTEAPSPGDQIVHLKFGLCTVLRIEGDFIHMAPVNGRVIRLSKAIVSFQLTEINNGRRVFSTSIKPQQ